MVLLAAATGAAAAALGKRVFGYNRENFMEDREQRLRMELAVRRFRVAQVELWREDVRCFVSLTEKKMSIYLLVNVLLLGFTLNLWCEGLLPEGSPGWLVMGHQIAIAGSFTFLLLTVWLAMHASVAAQSYQARVLTQLVRLPVPTWEELEACRTYASDFEKVESRQMFRVPFLGGSQEDAASAGAKPDVGGNDCRDFPDAAIAADPWGLERSCQDEGSGELGCQMGEEVAKLRHIKFMRQAGVFWQTYDAFARVSMSIGVTQLMLAMSYYILGYALTQVRAPVPAFAGVIVLMCTAEVVARVDLTLPVTEQHLIQSLLIFGPLVSCVATYLWVQHSDVPARMAEVLAPVAFLSHGAVVGLLTMVLRVREQENGAMLPLAYSGVLFLDVFGWVSHKRTAPRVPDGEVGFGDATPPIGFRHSLSAVPEHEEAAPQPAEVAASVAADSSGRRRARWRWPVLWRSRSKALAEETPRAEAKQSINHYAVDYFASPVCSSDIGRSQATGNEGTAEALLGRCRAKPASLCVAYDAQGCPLPASPLDTRAPGVVDDYRWAAGAPRMNDTVNAIEPPAREFWDPVTFVPPDSRQRQQMDELLAERPDFGGHRRLLRGAGFGAEAPIETGHDNEVPGVLPWQIVKLAAAITSCVWLCAGSFCILQVAHMWSMKLPWWWEIPALEVNASAVAGRPAGLLAMLQEHDSAHLLNLLGLSRQSPTATAPAGELLAVRWPYQTITPQSLACDATGSRFLASDGLSVFVARLDGSDGSSTRRGLRGPQLLTPEGLPNLAFHRAPSCSVLQGEMLQDAALTCLPSGNFTGAKLRCEALLLHRHGRHLASCPLAGAGTGSSFVLGSAWLLPSKQGDLSSAEKVAWALADPNCSQRHSNDIWGSGCAWVGTTRGRLARLRLAADGQRLVPEEVFDGPTASGMAGGLRTAGADHLLSSKQARGHSLQLLATGGGDLKPEMELQLPTAAPMGGFCAGGGFVYALGSGPAPGIWRVPAKAKTQATAAVQGGLAP